jgi:hypothetical protein
MRRFLVTLVAVATLSGPMMAVTGLTPAAAQNQEAEDTLVNVQIGDVLSENRVTVTVAAQLVAQVCANANVNVAAILAAIEQDGDFEGTCRLASDPSQSVPITITEAPGGSPKGKN